MKWMLSLALVLVLNSNVYSSCKNPGPASEVATISNPSLEENSGIDFSRQHKNVFWTLNDANNTADIFAIDTTGKNLGAFEIKGAENVDWEDIAVAACFHNKAKDCIYIADIGNNKGKRKEFNIYVVEEPAELSGKSLSLKDTITFTEKGIYNFEAFSVNESTQEFYLVSKSDKKLGIQGISVVFSLAKGAKKLKTITTIYFTKFSEELSKEDMIVTSSDFHTESQTLLIGTYGKAFQISMKEIGTFSSNAKIVEVPKMEKSESIAYQENDGNLLIYTSSEGLDQPLYKISCK
jgi:hypothetical protein